MSTLTSTLREALSGLGFLILSRAMKKNVKKLKDLTYHRYTPFKHDEIINNRSTYLCASEENNVLRFGLQFLQHLSKNRCFCHIRNNSHSYEKWQTPIWEIQDEQKDIGTTQSIKKLQQNSDNIITRPDKGNVVVTLNKPDYLHDNDSSQFKKLNNDVTITRGSITSLFASSKETRFLRKITILRCTL